MSNCLYFVPFPAEAACSHYVCIVCHFVGEQKLGRYNVNRELLAAQSWPFRMHYGALELFLQWLVLERNRFSSVRAMNSYTQLFACVEVLPDNVFKQVNSIFYVVLL